MIRQKIAMTEKTLELMKQQLSEDTIRKLVTAFDVYIFIRTKNTTLVRVGLDSYTENNKWIQGLEYWFRHHQLKPSDTFLSILTSGAAQRRFLGSETILNGVSADILKDVLLQEWASVPIHSVFLGVAYISGIDVSVDTRRGVELLTHAADQNVSEAWPILSHMYEHGMHIEKDMRKAWNFRKQYNAHLKECIRPTRYTPALDRRIQFSARSLLPSFLVQYYIELKLKDICAAKETAEQMIRYAQMIDDQTIFLETGYKKLGDVCRMQRNLSQAREAYQTSLTYSKNPLSDDIIAGGYGGLCVGNDDFAELCLMEGKLDEAESYFKQVLRNLFRLRREEPLFQVTHSILAIRSKQMRCYSRLSVVCFRKFEVFRALRYRKKSRKIKKIILELYRAQQK